MAKEKATEKINSVAFSCTAVLDDLVCSFFNKGRNCFTISNHALKFGVIACFADNSGITTSADGVIIVLFCLCTVPYLPVDGLLILCMT